MDYVAVAATVTLGVLAVADAVVISITERARGTGDDPRVRLARAGAAPPGDHRGRADRAGRLGGRRVLGLIAAAVFARQLPPLLFAAAGAAVVAGILVTSLAALLPAQLLHRLPAAQLLAEE